MGESIDVWREFFRTTKDTDVFEFIDKAIAIAALDRPKDFLSRRGRIAERLFSCETTRAGGDCALASEESKANGDAGNAAHDVANIKHSRGEAKTFSDDIRETPRVVGEVLRIKRVLDNSRNKSDSALLESLRKLRSMTIAVDTLEKTKIGISVNNLQKSGSNQIAQLAHNITMGWKALVEEICHGAEDVAGPRDAGDGKTSSVENRNIRKQGQERYDFNKAGSLANRNRRLNANLHKGIVTPNTTSARPVNSRTSPASEVASRKFEKERLLQSQDSNGSVAGIKSRQDKKIKGWNEVEVDHLKFQATKRKMQELYQKAEADKKRRTMQVLDPRDLPKMAASLEAPCATTAKARWRKLSSRSRVSWV